MSKGILEPYKEFHSFSYLEKIDIGLRYRLKEKIEIEKYSKERKDDLIKVCCILAGSKRVLSGNMLSVCYLSSKKRKTVKKKIIEIENLMERANRYHRDFFNFICLNGYTEDIKNEYIRKSQIYIMGKYPVDRENKNDFLRLLYKARKSRRVFVMDMIKDNKNYHLLQEFLSEDMNIFEEMHKVFERVGPSKSFYERVDSFSDKEMLCSVVLEPDFGKNNREIVRDVSYIASVSIKNMMLGYILNMCQYGKKRDIERLKNDTRNRFYDGDKITIASRTLFLELLCKGFSYDKIKKARVQSIISRVRSKKNSDVLKKYIDIDQYIKILKKEYDVQYPDVNSPTVKKIMEKIFKDSKIDIEQGKMYYERVRDGKQRMNTLKGVK